MDIDRERRKGMQRLRYHKLIAVGRGGGKGRGRGAFSSLRSVQKEEERKLLMLKLLKK